MVDNFRLLGRAMAKALQDNRMLDLPLAPAFYKLALGQVSWPTTPNRAQEKKPGCEPQIGVMLLLVAWLRMLLWAGCLCVWEPFCCLPERGWWWWGVQELDLHDLVSLDPALGQQVEQLDLLIRRHKHRQQAGGATGGADLLLGGASVEELCLDFTLPGYPEYELKEGGAECSVTLANLEEYVTLLLQATLDTGVAPQVDAFRTGFNQVRHPANRRNGAPARFQLVTTCCFPF